MEQRCPAVSQRYALPRPAAGKYAWYAKRSCGHSCGRPEEACVASLSRAAGELLEGFGAWISQTPRRTGCGLHRYAFGLQDGENRCHFGSAHIALWLSVVAEEFAAGTRLAHMRVPHAYRHLRLPTQLRPAYWSSARHCRLRYAVAQPSGLSLVLLQHLVGSVWWVFLFVESDQSSGAAERPRRRVHGQL